MTRLFFGLAALVIIAPPALAESDGQSAWYGELHGGTVFALDSDVDIPGLNSEISMDTGWMIEAATGFSHGSGFRGELALGYRSNDFDEIEISGFGSADISGDIWALTTMANGYFDIHLDRLGLDGMFWSRMTPFVGGGVGVAFLEVGGDLGSENDVAFAYQGLGGMSYSINSQWDGTLTYSYFSALDPKFNGVGFDYDSHNVLAGSGFTRGKRSGDSRFARSEGEAIAKFKPR
jgi:opacity protein-like surface antigen